MLLANRIQDITDPRRQTLSLVELLEDTDKPEPEDVVKKTKSVNELQSPGVRSYTTCYSNFVRQRKVDTTIEAGDQYAYYNNN